MANFKKLTIGAALAATLFASTASAETVRFWYHFDNPENPMADLVAKFEAANPDIKIEAENVPWNSYYDTLYTSLVGGNAPDAAMVKLFAQPRLVEMGALEPLGDKIDAWAGKADLLDNLLELNKGPDGQQYYLPIQYVVLYLYYRADLFEQAGLQPPKTCDEFRDAAIKLTKAPTTYGFGLRGGKGGWDQWGAFVLSQGAELKPGGLTNPQNTITKNTALGTVIGVGEILNQATTAQSFSGNATPLMMGAIAYIVLFIPVVAAGRWIETRFAWRRV